MFWKNNRNDHFTTYHQPAAAAVTNR